MQMKFSDGQAEFSLVFNFAILGYLRKLDAHEKLSVLQYFCHVCGKTYNKHLNVY